MFDRLQRLVSWPNGMYRDFTLTAYRQLLQAAIDAGYHAMPFRNYVRNSDPGKTLILRHDVDRKPQNSLAVARLEASLDVRGTYYFRILPESYDERVIKQIAELGHEIGYHYEDLALFKGDREGAIAHFGRALARFRKIYPVETICMHGSPLSKWDNRQLWQTYDYRSFGILAEPYLDVDFSRVLYLTDTGRRWNGEAVSVRDKVQGLELRTARTTFDLIDTFRSGRSAPWIMQTVHPQRWTDDATDWMCEFVMQNTKNAVKRAIFVRRQVDVEA